MGLYLCIFDPAGDEIDGVEVGPYADFNALRGYVTREIECGKLGTKFPTFIIHSDSDGEWSVADCIKLRDELSGLISEMKLKPPVPFVSDWQLSVAKSVGLIPKNAFESFVDVDGEFVIERIQRLVSIALEQRLSILFQ
jgi:hypothetical protein